MKPRAVAPIATSVIIIVIGLLAASLVVFVDQPNGQTSAVQSQSLSNQFGVCCSNVETVTLASATLYGGVSETKSNAATSSVTFSVNNPGSETTINSLTLTGSGLSSPMTQWSTTSSAGFSPSVNFAASYQNAGQNALGSNQETSFTFYPFSSSSESVTTGQTFNYVVNFANGQSISGSLIAQ